MNKDWPANQRVVQDYFDFCRLAGTDDEAFKTFKTNPAYQMVLEHLNESDGQYYIDLMNNEVPYDLELLKINDFTGDSQTFNYEGWGKISPSTLRYIKNVWDIGNAKLLGNHDDESVVEIGGGYGGLARVLLTRYPTAIYTLIDNADVNLLSRKYLDQWDVAFSYRVQTQDYRELFEITHCDLAISNYALSELSLSLQVEYFYKILSKANHLYITYNFILSDSHMNFQIMMDKITKLFKVDVLTENPGNKIILGVRK